jgi:hypothetical protein
MRIEDLTVVVCCNKSDYYFARICIASIRYYYPDITIELVKDAGKGYFDTRETEKCFNVLNVDLGVKKMGWSAAKLLYLYKFPPGKKLLILDSDIVFIGPFLEKLLPVIEQSEYVVSIENETDPYAEWVKGVYFDTRKIEQRFPDYKFPGYFFNAGQMFVTTGAIDKNVFNDFFDVNNYPFWKQEKLFPLVDQSLYNYLLPTLNKQKKIKLGTAEFMIWSKSGKLKNISLDKVINRCLVDEGLIHWAGDVRTPLFERMNRADILLFFEDFYYQKVSIRILKKYFRRFNAVRSYYFRRMLQKVIRLVSKQRIYTNRKPNFF